MAGVPFAECPATGDTLRLGHGPRARSLMMDGRRSARNLNRVHEVSPIRRNHGVEDEPDSHWQGFVMSESVDFRST